MWSISRVCGWTPSGKGGRKQPGLDCVRAASLYIRGTDELYTLSMHSERCSLVCIRCTCVRHFYPHSSAGFQINIHLTTRLHTTHVRFFSSVYAKFHQFCSFLERMKTDGAKPEILLVRFVLYAYILVSLPVGPGL